MAWTHYIAAFFAGAFLTNMVPHFVNGLSGNKFPTPFAKPPGRGLSSPLVNVLWALVNLVVGYVLFSVADISNENIAGVLVLFAGIVFMSLVLSTRAAKKHRE